MLMDGALSGLIFASGLDSQGCALCGWIEPFQGWVLRSLRIHRAAPCVNG